MLTTEEKAKQNWCPMARIARRETFEVRRPAVGDMEWVNEEAFIPGGCNRDALSGNGSSRMVLASCRCYGSDCMMWRWDELRTINLRQKFLPAADTMATTEPVVRTPGTGASWQWCPHDPLEGEPAGWLEPESEMLARRVGYCGLAGMPVGIAKEVEEHGR